MRLQRSKIHLHGENKRNEVKCTALLSSKNNVKIQNDFVFQMSVEIAKLYYCYNQMKKYWLFPRMFTFSIARGQYIFLSFLA